ncbi:type I glyceraldehyde-3-phosphate dehydrogenase [Phototrophicus methaneseepsis]|uniref:Glyceraldehyde-3-phosphate dehydrogenase n=1 Tax=Phototrophicus methaneseepsis TaxID=2710758 RepID=A0A7S8E9D7_9CHLR|nr:type I glyceraldehyde-3-phosphate dehydrogenase [Phototrophicus methaneseepsis]QPC82818.1 type I glyceraldehyde-3-phosphate dehydrogenase [Phototrophicus methaneseepsis]
MAKVAINGLGRIGRATLKTILEKTDLDLVAVNDIGSLDNLAYLLSHDTAYGRYNKSVETNENKLIIDGHEIAFLQERDPAQLPWADMGIDLVFECVGIFTTMEGASKHIEAGAKFVIISAPTKSADVPTIVHGVNTPDGSKRVISCASCTTNSITPVVEVLDRHIGIEKAMLTTVHAYTSTQELVDTPLQKDFRRGRAAAQNIIPTSTGAAIATTKALPQLEDKFDGIAIRVPVIVGSISDMVFVTKRDTTVEELNDIFRQEATSERYEGIMGITEEPLVSSDIIGESHASVVDLSMTRVVDGNLVKVMAWYDNEWSYTNQMVRQGVAALKDAGLIPA